MEIPLRDQPQHAFGGVLSFVVLLQEGSTTEAENFRMALMAPFSTMWPVSIAARISSVLIPISRAFST